MDELTTVYFARKPFIQLSCWRIHILLPHQPQQALHALMRILEEHSKPVKGAGEAGDYDSPSKSDYMYNSLPPQTMAVPQTVDSVKWQLLQYAQQNGSEQR
eukprot:1160486-Pelagomonas_calceolata.AAC.7